MHHQAVRLQPLAQTRHPQRLRPHRRAPVGGTDIGRHTDQRDLAPAHVDAHMSSAKAPVVVSGRSKP